MTTEQDEVRGHGGKLSRRLHGIPRTPKELDRSLVLLTSMRDMGWQASANRGRPIDAEGRPIPWLSYPAITWLQPRLRREDWVFEYGAGHSTLWFANRVERVVAVEHDQRWIEYLEHRLQSNAEILSRPSLGDEYWAEGPTSHYADAMGEFSQGRFDVVVVDGMERNSCALVAAERVARNGLIVYDNSDRPNSRDGVAALLDGGFMTIEFVGFTAGYGHRTCTSVFFRDWTRWLGRPVLPNFLGY